MSALLGRTSVGHDLWPDELHKPPHHRIDSRISHDSASLHWKFIGDSSPSVSLSSAEDEATERGAGGVSIYTAGWIVTILGIALLGEAMRQGGQGFNSRHAIAWLVVFVGMAFLGGIVGGLIASAL
jgi:hypothetical protein